MVNTIQQERRKTMLDDKYLYQIPFGGISDISTANMHQINKEWLKKVKPKKRMTKKEYKRWKNKLKGACVV